MRSSVIRSLPSLDLKDDHPHWPASSSFLTDSPLSPLPRLWWVLVVARALLVAACRISSLTRDQT